MPITVPVPSAALLPRILFCCSDTGSKRRGLPHEAEPRRSFHNHCNLQSLHVARDAGSTGNSILTVRQVVRAWQNPKQGSLPSETKRCLRSKDKSAANAAKKPNLKRRPPGREARFRSERREGASDEESPVPLSYPTAEQWRNISRVLPSGNDNPPLSKIDTPQPPSPPSAMQQPTLSRICQISADAVGKGIP